MLFEARAQGVARRPRRRHVDHIGGRRLSYHNSGWRWGVGRRRREHVARRRRVVAGRRVAVGVSSWWLWRLRHCCFVVAARHGAARAELEQQPTRLSLFLSAVRCGVGLRAVVCCAATFLRVYLCNLCWSRAKCRPRLSSSALKYAPVYFFSEPPSRSARKDYPGRRVWLRGVPLSAPRPLPGAKKGTATQPRRSRRSRTPQRRRRDDRKRIDSPLLASKTERHHPRDDRRDGKAPARQRLLEEEHRREGRQQDAAAPFYRRDVDRRDARKSLI